MSDDARVIALVSECNGKDVELTHLRAENATLRTGIHGARHHLAMALRALNLDPAALQPTTDRYGNGG